MNTTGDPHNDALPAQKRPYMILDALFKFASSLPILGAYSCSQPISGLRPSFRHPLLFHPLPLHFESFYKCLRTTSPKHKLLGYRWYLHASPKIGGQLAPHSNLPLSTYIFVAIKQLDEIREVKWDEVSSWEVARGRRRGCVHLLSLRGRGCLDTLARFYTNFAIPESIRLSSLYVS